MGVFISVISKNNTSVKKLILSKMNNKELESSLNTEFDIKNTFISKNENIGVVNFATDCLIYTAEESFFYGKNGEYTAIQGDILPRHTEYSEDDFLKAADVCRILSYESYAAFKKRTSGTYSIIHVTSEGNVISFNDSLGYEHLYYAETSDNIFISNRIRLIRCFLGQQGNVDLYTLSNIVLMGSVLGTGTSIREIRRLPQGSYISVKNGRLDIHSDPLFFYNDPEISDACEEDFIGFLKKELIVCSNRMAAVLRHKDDFAFALSGGKDSRALLAILMSIKDIKDINVFTNGYEDHPDVIAAKKITEHYGIHHKINIPTPPAVLTADELLEKMMGSVFQTDGMIGLFNAKGNKNCNLDDIAFPGHINEVFRQFTKPSIKLNSLEDVISYYKKIHLYDPLGLMTDELHDRFDKQFTERAVSLNNAGLSLNDNNDAYFFDRLVNWGGYLLRQDGYAQNQFHVLNNDRLIKSFYRKGCSAFRKMELLHFIIMKEFADKWLVETPFAVQHWDPSLEPFAHGVNISNPGIPVPDNMPLHGTWQLSINTSYQLKVKLMEIFLSYPDSDIWKLYNKEKVLKSFLSSKLSYTPMISLYGFINMFFYNHNIEIPMRLKSERRRTKTENVIIKDISGSGIYKYNNQAITPFKNYDELTKGGYSGMYRFPASAYAVTAMENKNIGQGDIE